MFKYLYNWINAFRAGWIANRCDICILDNEKEEIRACLIHSAEIERLHKKQKD